MAEMTENDIINAIAGIANTVTRFKIGKTGQTVAERWDGDYREGYDNIKGICQSKDKKEIDGIEERMIKYFSAHPFYSRKIQNQQIGGGEMKDSNVYIVYVVY